MFENAVIKII